jgi:hypothetical protein
MYFVRQFPNIPTRGAGRRFALRRLLAAMNKIQIKICPYVTEPRPGCFCLDMNSRNIELVIRYCSGDYEECSIYREQIKVDI